MSSTTENLGLTLPDVTDFYDVGVTNTNMSLIDSAVGQIADTGAKETSVQSIITSVGTTTDTGGTATTGTVMGKLNTIQTDILGIKNDGETFKYAQGNYVYTLPNEDRTVTLFEITTAGKLQYLYLHFHPRGRSESSSQYTSFKVILDGEILTTFNAYNNNSYSEQDINCLVTCYQVYPIISPYFTSAYSSTNRSLSDTTKHSQTSHSGTSPAYALWYTYISNSMSFSTLSVECTFYARTWNYSTAFPAEVSASATYTFN